MKEFWKSISGYEGMYEVSNKGNVRSLDRKIYNKGNDSFYQVKGRMIKQSACGKEYENDNHYLSVSLCKDGVGCHKRVHRLVANAFVPNPDNKPFVNHDNGIKYDNRDVNLSWTTDRENKIHASNNGLMSKGESSGTNVLTKNQVLEIRSAYDMGCFSYKDLAEAYDVHKQTIAPIIRGETWQHLL